MVTYVLLVMRATRRRGRDHGPTPSSAGKAREGTADGGGGWVLAAVLGVFGASLFVRAA